MNNEEAIGVLEAELAGFRTTSYSELVQRISQPAVVCERPAPNGTRYQIEIQVCWDSRPGGNIRVMGSVDNGGWRAFIPLTRDFIVAPDGSFVGE